MNFNILAGLTEHDIQILKEAAQPQGLQRRDHSSCAIADGLSRLGLLHCPSDISGWRTTRLGLAALEADAARRRKT